MDSVTYPTTQRPLTAIETEALELIRREKSSWDTGTAFITDRVAFQMRNAIRLFRKNYWGAFDEPNDPVTGRRKIWSPLTEYFVEAAVKNNDLDSRDIGIRAKKASAQPFATVLRQAVHNFLEKINFGETLDALIRQTAIDGTAVWKTYEEKGPNGKKRMVVKLVDLLNFYIDPTVDSIREAESVIERALMMPEEIAKMDGWMNTQGLSGTSNFNRYDGQLPYVPSTTQGQVKMREVFERWGKMPKFLITGNKTDTEQIEGHIVASSNSADWVIHLIEENTKTFHDGYPWRPYEECWYTKIHSRWYGKGIAEKVMWLQLHLNTILGIRNNRAIVQQLGLFKIRAGSNITPQMIGRLAANGAIKVTDMADIEPLEFPQSGLKESYQDEENIVAWGQRITSLFDPATGDQTPADTTATATAIQSQSSQSQFVLIKEGIGMFLTRWMKNHALPIIVKQMKRGDIVRLTGEYDEIAQIDEWQVNRELADFIDKATKSGKVVDVAQVEFERERSLKRLQGAGSDRFVNLDDAFDPTEYDVEVEITNEEVNKAVLMQNLTGMLPNVPDDMKAGIVKEVFDLVGLDPNQLQSKTPVLAQTQQPGQQLPQQNPSAPRQLQQANQPVNA